MKYRKKPVEIEALQWTGQNHKEVSNFCRNSYFFHIEIDKSSTTIYIETSKGTIIAKEGDYIIKDGKGEYYPCKEDVFNLTYDKINYI